jgi:hypothetical protein
VYYPPHFQDITSELSEKVQELLWAYSYYNYRHYGSPSTTNPKPIRYAWSSRTFMNGPYSGVDAHTFIHETGHLLGLDDYYTYSEDDYDAMGGIDMMDYNVGDHNAYSKFFLGWTKPFVVDRNHPSSAQSFTMDIKPFESSGEHVLIKDNWNGSALDEYISLEFYTPTGVNEKDSRGYYDSLVPGVPGIKIIHVDSRLGVYNLDGDFLRYTRTLDYGSNYYSFIAASNSRDYSKDPKFKLVSLIDSSGVNVFKQGGYAGDSTLFRQGSSFSASSHSQFFVSRKFNGGQQIGYSVSVVSMSAESARITITRL